MMRGVILTRGRYRAARAAKKKKKAKKKGGCSTVEVDGEDAVEEETEETERPGSSCSQPTEGVEGANPYRQLAAEQSGGSTQTAQLAKFLEESIKEKESNLECPVCLEVTQFYIYEFLQSHVHYRWQWSQYLVAAVSST